MASRAWKMRLLPKRQNKLNLGETAARRSFGCGASYWNLADITHGVRNAPD